MNESVRGILNSAQERLLREGPAAAIEWLGQSPCADQPEVIRRLHALVWQNRERLPAQLLAQSYLDRVYCQCSACDATWLVSPLLRTGAYSQQPVGVECDSCHRVLCATCGEMAGDRCACGASLSTLREPNGRTHVEPLGDDGDSFLRSLLPPAPDVATERYADLHLYCGFEGRVPFGVDDSFTWWPVGPADAVLRWIETLVDCGVYYQAHEMLEALDESHRQTGHALLLRARLAVVRSRNARERSRRRLDVSLSTPDWWELNDQIKNWLEEAVRLAPDLGPAWLLSAQLALDEAFDLDPVRARVCAQHARRLLGDVPQVLLTLGKALRAGGCPAEAVETLRQISEGTPEFALAERDLYLAKLEVRCEAQPVDVEAHLELGRWCCRHGEVERARVLFLDLTEACPERAEGHFGLGRVAFQTFSADRGEGDRYEEAYRHCREALSRNPQFGPALELMGSVYYNVQRTSFEVSFPREDPLPYFRRAIEHDASCDTALWLVAKDFIARGEIPPAEELLEEAAALDTQTSEVYDILAAIYKGKRLFEKEWAARRRARELSPGTVLSQDYENQILQACGHEY